MTLSFGSVISFTYIYTILKQTTMTQEDEKEINILKERIKQLEKEKSDAIYDKETKDFYSKQKGIMPHPNF